MDNAGEITPLTYQPAEAAGQQAAPSQMRNGMKADVTHMIETSTTSWLTKYQVIYLLENWRGLGLTLSTSTPHLPPSGTLFLIDRHVNRYFRKDGHQVRARVTCRCISAWYPEQDHSSSVPLHALRHRLCCAQSAPLRRCPFCWRSRSRVCGSRCV